MIKVPGKQSPQFNVVNNKVPINMNRTRIDVAMHSVLLDEDYLIVGGYVDQTMRNKNW